MEPQAFFYIAGTQVNLDGYQMWRQDSIDIDIVITPALTLTTPAYRWTAKMAAGDQIATIEKTGADFTVLDPARPNRIDLKFSITPTDTEGIIFPVPSSIPTKVSTIDLIWDFQITANSRAYVKTFPKGRYGRLSIAADLSVDAP